MKAEVLKFIGRFTDGGKRDQVEECFTRGCCWWFATILAKRFAGGYIMYCAAENHFGCMIENRVYDITGDVTEDCRWERWEDFERREPGVWSGIVKNCIYF